MTLTFDWTISVGGVEIPGDLVKGAGSIDYGRQTRDSGFTAPRAIFDLYTQAGYPQYTGDWPVIDAGMPVTIHVTWDGVTQWRRHTGTVQAIDWKEKELTVTTVGLIEAYTRINVGGTGFFAPIPTENDSTRVERLWNESDPALTIEGSAGRWLRAIPVNTPTQPLLDALLRIAADSEALLMEDRLGVPRYRTRNFTKPSLYTLPVGCVAVDGLQATFERGDIVNAVSVFYGEPKDTTGLQRFAYLQDDDSIAAWGVREQEVTTDLQFSNAALGTGAAGYAAQYLAEHSAGWILPDVPVLMWTLSGSEADDVLDLQEGWPIRVTDLPTGCPVGESYDGDVIGFTDIMHGTDYRIIMHLAPTVTPATEPDEEPIYPDGIITGWDTSGIDDSDEEGREYRWCVWTQTGGVTIDYDGDVVCRILQAAGGGGGGDHQGSAPVSGGPGGAGGVYHATFQPFNPGYWPVEIGAGGPPGNPGTVGGDTVFYGARIYGGGYGTVAATVDAGDGGSGGAPGFQRGTSNTYGSGYGAGITGMGNDGGYGAGSVHAGGAGGPGTSGGPGLTVYALAGDVSMDYGRSGLSEQTSGAPRANKGDGGFAGWSLLASTAGSDGVLVLQYRIA